MPKYSVKQVRASIRKFEDFAHGVRYSDFHTFDDNFSFFIDHCENDHIMKVIIDPLKNLASKPSLLSKLKEFVSAVSSSVAGSALYQLLVSLITP